MNKLLLGTSALFAAAALTAGSADAQTPKVTIGGFADFQAGYVDGDLDAGQRSHGFRNDTEVSIRVDGATDMGLKYGARVDLEADVTGDADNEGLNAARTFVYLSGDNWGRFELGSTEGAAETMRVDASSIAVATGGIDGDWHYFANPVNALGGQNALGAAYITSPRLPLAHGSVVVPGDESTQNAAKITYYTPRFSGLQAGISYQPDFSDRGQGMTLADTNPGQSGENVAVGLNYKADYGDVTTALSATGQMGNSEGAGEDLKAYNVGAVVGFSGAKIAGSWGDWRDSLNGNSSDGEYWTAGIGYGIDKFGASVTYIDSSYEVAGLENDFDNLVIGADYRMAPGLTPYAEVSLYDFDATGAANDNDGTVVIVGTQLAF